MTSNPPYKLMDPSKVVKIKTWEKVEATYGLTRITGVIACKYRFTHDMEKQLPSNRIITLDSYGESWQTDSRNYDISSDMIEEYLPLERCYDL